MKTRLTLFAAALLAAATLAATPARAQTPAQTPAAIAPASATDATAGPVNFTTEQLVTSTVHEAWVMSGKNEATFFAIVTQLAELSAQKRNLTLPESAEAGQRVGEMIKKMASKDHDQLLYAVVDAAVRKVGKPAPATAGQ